VCVCVCVCVCVYIYKQVISSYSSLHTCQVSENNVNGFVCLLLGAVDHVWAIMRDILYVSTKLCVNICVVPFVAV
jgi:hypothetical protein